MDYEASYFEGKKPWSKTKDDLLRTYLYVFFIKVYSTRYEIVYVDGFAGAGKYEDGTIGSPMLALEAATVANRNAKFHPKVNFVFSEKRKDHSECLLSAVRNSSYTKRYRDDAVVLNADYRGAITSSLENYPKARTFFYYIDPCGIVDLRFDVFETISRKMGARHTGTEILLNFSSQGFLREALAALKLADAIPGDIDPYDEGFDVVPDSARRADRLDSIVGGNWWRDIVQKCGHKEIGYWEAERQVSQGFCNALSQLFSYVTNMPIRETQRSNRVKYRMIHMTNHPQGCIEMNNCMIKRYEDRETQQIMFEVDFELDDVGSRMAEFHCASASVISSLPIGSVVTSAELSARLIAMVGVVKRWGDLCRMFFAQFEESGILERMEKETPRGRKKRSWAKGDKFIIRGHPTLARRLFD